MPLPTRPRNRKPASRRVWRFPSVRPRLEALEDRITPDVGDTLGTALLTTLGPADGSYAMNSEPIGDGLFGNKDVDLYRLDAQPGQMLRALTSQPSGGQGMDTFLRLFDSSGGLLATNDDGGLNLYSQINYTFTAADTYYVGVSGYPNRLYDPNVGGSGSSGSVGDYRLDLDLVTPAPDAAGDTLADAQVLPLGPGDGSASATAEIGDGVYLGRDVDLYRFEVTADQLLTATVSLPPGGLAFSNYLRIFDATGNQLNIRFGSSSTNLLRHQFAAGGTYYIGVSGAYNGSYDPNVGGSGSSGQTGDYRLDVDLLTPTPDAAGQTLDAALATDLGPADGTYSNTTQIGDGLFPVRDVDLYRFDVAANQVLTGTVSLPAGGTGFTNYLRIFDADGNQLAIRGAYNSTNLLPYQFTSGGTYYIGVSGSPNYNYDPTVAGTGRDGAAGDYRLDLELSTPTPDAAGQTLDAAQVLPFGPGDGSFDLTSEIGDGLYPLRDVDLYRFDATAGQVLTAFTAQPSGGQSMTPTLRLFDAAGNQLARNFFGNGGGQARIEYQFTDSDTYYVGVSGYPNTFYDPNVAGSGRDGSLGDYQLDLTLATPTPDAAGQTLDTALATDLGPADGTYSNTAVIGDGLFPLRDVDLYQIEATAGQGLLAVTSPSPGQSMTTALRLFDADGNQLASNTFGNGSYARLQYLFTDPGTYYVGVSGYPNLSYDPNDANSGGGILGSRGDYRLDLELLDPPLDSAGDRISQALDTGLGPVQGSYTNTTQIGDSWFGNRDVDLYRFEAEAGQALTATTAYPGGDYLRTVLRLFDADGNQLAIHTSNGSVAQIREFIFTASGTYYIGVSGAYNTSYDPDVGGSGSVGDIGDYRLTLDLVTPTPDAEGDTLDTALDTGLGPADDIYAVASATLGNGLYLSRDVDLYRFEAAAGQVVTAVNGLLQGGFLNPFLRLFDADGNQVRAAFTSFEYTVPTAGTYYLGVSGYPNTAYDPTVAGSGVQGQTGNYRLTLSVITPAPDKVGDTLDTALETKLGPNAGIYTLPDTRIGDGLYVSRDRDLYHFRASTGQVFRASTVLPEGGVPADIVLRLFDADGNQVASVTGTDSTAYLELAIPAQGTYYLGVSGYPNTFYNPRFPGGGSLGSQGDYTLTMSLDRLTGSPVEGPARPIRSVRGHGIWSFDFGLPAGGQNIDQISIDAWIDASGRANGTMSWTSVYNDLPGDGGQQNSGYPWIIQVDTLLIEGNTAHIEGVVVSSGQQPEAIGRRVTFDVVDNGPGRLDTLDGFPLFNGNFQIWTRPNEPLQATSAPEAPVQEALTADEARPLLDEAITRLEATGMDTSGIQDVQVAVTNLGDTLLGRSDGAVIWVDDNAAGWGWFVDATPGDDREFTTPGDQGEQGRIDLLTVLTHELGHVLGLHHDEGGLMAETLAPGTRLAPVAEDPDHSPAPPFVPGEVLIGLEGEAAESFRAQGPAGVPAAVEALGLHSPRVLADTPSRVATRWLLPEGADVLNAVAALAGRPGIAYAEPNYVLHIDATPDDPLYPDLWGLENTGQTGGTPGADIDAPLAWDITTGTGTIVVGVIDTGVDYTHPDLAANMWTNPGEIPGNGLDDDGNGFVDDVHGYDFINNDGDPFDDNGHGTHTAGTIGAVGDNALGVAGVNWNVQIVALKFLGAGGSGSTADAVEALNYATQLANSGVNIRLTSNSWGGGGFSQTMEDAIAASGQAGMLFVAAAGNSNSDNDNSPHYPSSYDLDNVIAVAATDHDDARASFSSYGATSVDLAAPGVDVLSTLPGDSYGTLSGTSMATPHVSGVAALAWGLAPGATYQEVRDALFAGVDPVPSMQGITVTGGRLNAFNTLQELGMVVSGSDPARGEIVTAPPTDFAVHFSFPYDPTALDAAVLQVNGVANDSLTLTDADTLTFHFTTSPVTAEGVQTLHMAAGAVRMIDNPPLDPLLKEWNATFRYDALRMEVTATDPADGSTVPLPGFTSLRVSLNEAYDPASVGTDDLTLGQGSVTGFTLVDATTIEYTLTGITTEGPLAVAMPAGALTDGFGNPMVGYSGSFVLDYGTFPFPTPLSSHTPAGGLIHDGSATGFLGPAGDADSFTITLDEGQTIAVVVDPDATLQPTVTLTGPGLGGIATAPAAGTDAVIEADGPTGAGVYTITVEGAAGTTGAYMVQVVLDAAVELEEHDGADNDTPADAQSLDGAVLDLHPGTGVVERTGVVGSVVASPARIFQEVGINDLDGSWDRVGGGTDWAINASGNPDSPLNVGVVGAVNKGNDFVDTFYFTALAGDVVTLRTWGKNSGGGSLGEALLDLHAADGSIIAVGDPVPGAPSDYLIDGFVIPEDGQYHLHVWTEKGSGDYTVTVDRTTPADLSRDSDHYSITIDASAGPVPLTLVAGQGSRSAPLQLELFGPGQNLVASAGTDASGQIVLDYTAPASASGTYTVTFSAVGQGVIDYGLVVLTHALFNTGGNEDPAEAPDVTGRSGVLGRITTGTGDPSALPVIESFDGGDLSGYTEVGGASNATVTAAAAHDGPFGLEDATNDGLGGWLYRDDPAVQVGRGDLVSVWVRSSGDLTGRAYFGFGATAEGTLSLVMAPNTGQLVLQRNLGFGYQDLGSVSQTWLADHWYRLEVSWEPGGDLIGRLYDSDGTTLLNTVTGHDDTIASGGIAFRAFSSTKFFDTVQTGLPQPGFYRISLGAGDQLTLGTAIPGGGPGEFANALDPMIRLHDPSGGVVAADDNSAADGRNALLGYTVPAGAGGIYLIEVRASGATPEPTRGEYVLTIDLSAAPSPKPPVITSLSDNPDPVVQGDTLTLTAEGVGDPDGAVVGVSFYRDADGNGTLEPGSDTLLGTDTDGSDGWSLVVDIPSNFPTGAQTYFAQAEDDAGLLSNVVATTNTVKKKGGKPGNGSAGSASGEGSTTLTAGQAGGADTIGAEDGQLLGTLDVAPEGMVPLGAGADSAGGFTISSQQGESGHIDLLTALPPELARLLGQEPKDEGGQVGSLAIPTQPSAPAETDRTGEGSADEPDDLSAASLLDQAFGAEPTTDGEALVSDWVFALLGAEEEPALA